MTKAAQAMLDQRAQLFPNWTTEMKRAAEKILPFWAELKGGKEKVKAEKKAASLKAIVLSGWGVDQESGFLPPPPPPAFPAPKMLARPVIATQVLSQRVPVAAGLSYVNNQHGRGKRVKIMKAHPGE